MQERDLTAIGVKVEMPAAAASGSRRAHPGLSADSGQSGDRLAELAAWWATVAGTGPPSRVEQLWLTRAPTVGAVNAEVVVRPFDAPKSVSEAIDWAITVADAAVDGGTDLLLVSLAPEDRDDVSW